MAPFPRKFPPSRSRVGLGQPRTMERPRTSALRLGKSLGCLTRKNLSKDELVVFGVDADARVPNLEEEVPVGLRVDHLDRCPGA
jgi:hypothetical protein